VGAPLRLSIPLCGDHNTPRSFFSRAGADFLLPRARSIFSNPLFLLFYAWALRTTLTAWLSTTMTLSSDRDGGIASPPRAKPCSMTLETSRLENIGGSTKPFTGRPGSGGRPLLALALAQNHRSLIRQLTAVRGSQYPALPPPERPSPPLMPVPSGLFHPGPVFRGSTLKAGWLYVSLRERDSYAVIPLRRWR